MYAVLLHVRDFFTLTECHRHTNLAHTYDNNTRYWTLVDSRSRGAHPLVKCISKCCSCGVNFVQNFIGLEYVACQKSSLVYVGLRGQKYVFWQCLLRNNKDSGIIYGFVENYMQENESNISFLGVFLFLFFVLFCWFFFAITLNILIQKKDRTSHVSEFSKLLRNVA